MNPPTDKTFRRYGFIDKPRSLPEFEECKHGRYVLYSDYASLQSEAQKLRDVGRKILVQCYPGALASEYRTREPGVKLMQELSLALTSLQAALASTAETGGQR